LAGRRRLSGAYFIELARIRPDPTQPRRALGTDEQAELAQSIRQLGVLQPISVRYIENEDIYQIISGERRFHAARTAGLAEIPCWVQSPEENEILVRQLAENWLRADLSPFELADALVAIRDTHKYSQQELATVTGKPKSEISRLLALLDMTPSAQHAARSTEGLGKRQLYAIARAEPIAQEELVRKTHKHRLTAVETEKLAKKTLRSDTGSRSRGAPTTHRRFATSQASVVLTFRKRQVESADILRALEEVRQQVSADHGKGN
jgi:ParB family chromosome partitioning protein